MILWLIPILPAEAIEWGVARVGSRHRIHAAGHHPAFFEVQELIGSQLREGGRRFAGVPTIRPSCPGAVRGMLAVVGVMSTLESKGG